MARSSTSERNRRINVAIALLEQYTSSAMAVAKLVEQYGVSKRQAYRYVQEAGKAKHVLPVPEQKVVFTVKLPVSVVHRLRKLAKSTERSLSDVTTQAIQSFLGQGGRHG